MSVALELLAPAKNLEIGIAAIDHGADAVYIGAERFGARSSAGNSLSDISRLCDYAHAYKAKVYVTVNTILYDEELKATEELINQLYHIGVDAILVQDMAIFKMKIPPLTLHASTQADCRTLDKVRWLGESGFSRVVLARELSLNEIAKIHNEVRDVELEVFVHGALCVSFSGLCNASEYCFSRSANKGMCAQFCRLKFDLEDAKGKTLVKGKHLLSLKDMCRIDMIESLALSGVTSFKIEGRLKDISYVKNVTAAYNEELNKVVEKHPDLFYRSSLGKCSYRFKADLDKTFNRGFTPYFPFERKSDISSFDTPKAIGKKIGEVKEVKKTSFTIKTKERLSNGDGLCFINNFKELEGFRVNRVESGEVFPLNMPKDLLPGMILYRNSDQAFQKTLSLKSSERKIPLKMVFSENADGIELIAKIDNVVEASVEKKLEKTPAEKPQKEIILRQLSRLGNTPYKLETLEVNFLEDDLFIPSSTIAQMKRELIEKIKDITKESLSRTLEKEKKILDAPKTWPKELSYLYNVSNALSKEFYKERGLDDVLDAFENQRPRKKLLMQCSHCILYSLGQCLKDKEKTLKAQLPLYLKLFSGQRFKLDFDCKKCQMNVYAE